MVNNDNEGTNSRRAVRVQDVRWLPPQVNVYKVNVEGSCDAKLKAAGVGVIIRDWRGHFITACS